MLKKKSVLSRLAPWLLGLVLGLAAVQGYLVWKDVIRPWLGPIRRFGLIAAFQRGEIIYAGYNEAKYVRFLDAYLPEDARVILPDEANASFTDQNLMQFYLFPRPIEGCGDPASAACLAYARDPNSFLLAIKDFPPAELTVGKVFVPFPEPYNQLKGVYAPEKLAATLSVPAPETYNRIPNISSAAPFLEGATLLLFFLLGSVFVSLLLPRPSWIELLGLSIPLAMGALSWIIFLTSYLGVPITLATVALWAVLLLAAAVAAHWIFHRPFHILPVRESFQSVRKIWAGDRIAFLLGLGLLAWFGLSALVSVGSAYTTFDAIANWYLKGYAMVARHTIWAGDTWGGHVLAYPLNVQLSTAVFRLVDGDQLPGSKLLFPLLAFSLLLGCYQFLRRHAVGRMYALGADLLISTVPLFFVHATNGMANVPFTAYLVLGVLWAFDGFWFGKTGWALVGGSLLAFAAWTRPEGIGFGLALLAGVFAVAILGRKVRRVGKYVPAALLPILVFPGTWLVLLGARELRQDQVGSTLQIFFSHLSDWKGMLGSLGQIAAYTAKYFVTWRSAGFAVAASLLVFLLALIFQRRQDRRLPLWMLAVTCIVWLIPAVMFFIVPFSAADFKAFLDQSFDRAYLPAIVLLTVSAFLWFGNPEPAPIEPVEIKP